MTLGFAALNANLQRRNAGWAGPELVPGEAQPLFRSIHGYAFTLHPRAKCASMRRSLPIRPMTTFLFTSAIILTSARAAAGMTSRARRPGSRNTAG